MKSTNVILILGKRGTGKSFFAKKFIQQYPRYVFYDPLHQHSELGTVHHSLDTIDFAKMENIIYQPSQDNQEIFDKFFQKMWESNTANTCIAIEEITTYIEFNMPDYFGRFVRMGRNRGIGIIGITQRPKRLGGTLPALVDDWFIFRFDYEKDMDFIEYYVGKENAEKIRNLPDYEFLHLTPKGLNWHQPIGSTEKTSPESQDPHNPQEDSPQSSYQQQPQQDSQQP